MGSEKGLLSKRFLGLGENDMYVGLQRWHMNGTKSSHDHSDCNEQIQNFPEIHRWIRSFQFHRPQNRFIAFHKHSVGYDLIRGAHQASEFKAVVGQVPFQATGGHRFTRTANWNQSTMTCYSGTINTNFMGAAGQHKGDGVV